jgi:hypothetical protein
MKKEDLVERYFGNPEVLLGFMRQTRKPVFHKSNVFFRDIQHAVHDYFESVEGEQVSLPEAERMAKEIVQLYTTQGVLRQVNKQAYRLEGPAWMTPKDGTYAMLTLNGTPLPTEAIEPIVAEAPKAEEVKREEIRIANFELPIAPPKNAEPGHLDGRPFKPHEREYQFVKMQEERTTEATPSEKPKIAPPSWMKKN